MASCIARYLHDKDSDTSYSSFDDYLEPSTVANVLVENRLKNVEDGLLQYLSIKDKKSLLRVSP